MHTVTLQVRRVAKGPAPRCADPNMAFGSFIRSEEAGAAGNLAFAGHTQPPVW